MQFLYTIGIRIFTLLLKLAAPFHTKAKLWVEGRKGVFDTLEKAMKGNTQEVIWMHVSSLGEFEQGRPLIERIKSDFPHYKIVLTFFSPSGYEIRKNYDLADVVVYLPVDIPSNVKRFFDIVKPCKVFFVKYDFWYHYLHEASKRKIPTYLISALFREGQLFFKPYGGFYRRILHFFTTIFVQDLASEKLLKSINYNNVEVSGDTRVDRVAALADKVNPISHIKDFKGEDLLLIAGSTWQVDEELLVQFFQKNRNLSVKAVFAPHEIHQAHIQQLLHRLKAAQLSAVCYSTLSDSAALEQYDVLLIDSIGMLSSLYQYADVAYIGGGFGAGIHNTLEPAAFGVPIIFGGKYQKFNEAVSLVTQRGAFSVKKYPEFEIILEKLVNDSSFRKRAGEESKSFVDRQKGATSMVVSTCFTENC